MQVGGPTYFNRFTTTSVQSLDSVEFDICKQQIEDEVERKPSTMARPRSPQKKHQGSDHEQMQNMLDQTLLAIRQKLNVLSSERNQMEQQMETLASGIKEACVQCRKVSSGSTPNSSSLRRVRSVGESVACGVSPLTPKRVSISRDENDGVASDDAMSVRTRSSTSASRESLDSSPILSHKGSHSDSSRSLPTSLSQSSMKGSFSERSKINRVSTANSDVFIDDWFSALTIPELPESPRLSTSPCSRSPNYNRQTSTPDFHRRRQYHPSPHLQRNKRSSLPESVLNQIITDESFHASSVSLSQVSVCTDPGSSWSGSTTIVRRSSLTGQMEHVRRTIVKRNSSFNTPAKGLSSDLGPLSCSFGSLSESAAAVVTLRRPGHRPFLFKRQLSVLLPSIETTV